FQAARESAAKGVLAIGSNANQNDLAPDVILASATLGVPQAFVQVARDVKEGHMRADLYVEDLKGSAAVGVNPRRERRIPAPVRAAMEQARRDIIAGRLRMPGPG